MELTQRTRVVRQVAKTLGENEMPVLDAGFKVRERQEAGLSRYVVRLAANFAARRNVLPPYKGHGRRPEYGELVRPLAHWQKGKLIPATPPDRVETWKEDDIEFRAEFWDNVVRPDLKAHLDHPTLNLIAIHDPRFHEPWLLGCPLRLSGTLLLACTTAKDRWFTGN